MTTKLLFKRLLYVLYTPMLLLRFHDAYAETYSAVHESYSTTVATEKYETIRMSSLTTGERGKTDLNWKIIILDRADIIREPIKISHVSHVIFDGNNIPIENLGCDLFRFEGACDNVEIRNFKIKGDGLHAFVGGNSTEGIKRNINIHHNYIENQRVGISLNADLNGLFVSCSIHNNKIKNIIGEVPGHGYGIHLANVEKSRIYDNVLDNCERHSIYHAWGKNNTIQGNTIKNHRQNNKFAVRAALAVFRNSSNITIQNNTFENNHSVDIHVYSGVDSPSSFSHKRYGNQHGNVIKGNMFVHNKILNSSESIGIMIGYNVLSYEDYHFYIKDLLVEDNNFQYVGTNASNAIRAYYCDDLKIRRNTFAFDDSTRGDIINLSSKYKHDMKSKWLFSGNTIIAEKDIIKPINLIYITPDWYNEQDGITIRVKDNTLINNNNNKTYNYRLYSNKRVIRSLSQRD